MAASTPTTHPHILITGTYASGEITFHAYSPSHRGFTLLQRLTSSSPGPSWLHLSRDKKILYAVTEGKDEETGGGIDAYELSQRGWKGVRKVLRVKAVFEPVSIDTVAGRVMVTAS